MSQGMPQEKSNTTRNLLLGCCGGSCLLAVVVVVVVAVLGVSEVKRMQALLENEPLVEAYEPTQAEIEQLERKAERVEQARQNGDEVTLVLTSADINTFIAQEMEGVREEMQAQNPGQAPPRIRVNIREDRLTGELTIPAENPETQQIAYVNGTGEFTASVNRLHIAEE